MLHQMLHQGLSNSTCVPLHRGVWCVGTPAVCFPYMTFEVMVSTDNVGSAPRGSVLLVNGGGGGDESEETRECRT